LTLKPVPRKSGLPSPTTDPGPRISLLGEPRVRTPAGLHLAYLSGAHDPAAQAENVLGIATFNGSRGPVCGGAGIPVAPVHMPLLDGAPHRYEVWSMRQPSISGRNGRVHFRRTEGILFGAISLCESELGTAQAALGGTAPSPLQQVTAQLYGEICATLEAEGYPHLLRVWNYLPHINRDSDGTERYRQFNTARQTALRAFGRAVVGSVPAASALGSVGEGPVVVYFFAGRTAPIFIENPRQVSAYHYPAEYGTHRPAFSRAALLTDPEHFALFISGTASIVGHRSLHPGDVAAQTRETLSNIEALVAEANRLQRGMHFSMGTLVYKVYVRRPADLPLIQAELATAACASAQTIYLQADICRQDLLVEIEATGIAPAAAVA
jgi:chorismate lyase / 3-hydroxybenzoate synthase